MNNQNDTYWKQLWELSIILLGVFFAAYTIAKDFVDNSQNTVDALKLSFVTWLYLMVSLMIGTVIITFVLYPIGRSIWNRLKSVGVGEVDRNMTIREDAGNLLLYIYKRKTEDKEMLNPNELLAETGWNKIRLNNASQYLIDSGFVKGHVLKGEGSTKVVDALIFDITPSGINIVEKQPEFKQNFGFTINLGLIEINWGAQES